MRAYWDRLQARWHKGAWRQKAGARAWIRRGGSLLLFLLAVLSGFWLALPEQQLLHRGRAALYQASGLVVSAQGMEIGFPLELRFSQCRLEPLPVPEPVQLDMLRVTPRWRRLLLGNPTLEVEAVGYGGRFSGLLDGAGYLDAQVRDIDLSRMGGLPGGYRVAGRLHGSVQGAVSGGSELAWQLELVGLEVSGLEALGVEQPLVLGQAVSRGRLQGQTLKVEALQLGQGMLEASGNGSLILGADLASSRIAASFKVRAGNNLPALFDELLALSGQSPDAEGWRAIRLNGRLDTPRLR